MPNFLKCYFILLQNLVSLGYIIQIHIFYKYGYNDNENNNCRIRYTIYVNV